MFFSLLFHQRWINAWQLLNEKFCYVFRSTMLYGIFEIINIPLFLEEKCSLVLSQGHWESTRWSWLLQWALGHSLLLKCLWNLASLGYSGSLIGKAVFTSQQWLQLLPALYNCACNCLLTISLSAERRLWVCILSLSVDSVCKCSYCVKNVYHVPESCKDVFTVIVVDTENTGS